MGDLLFHVITVIHGLVESEIWSSFQRSNLHPHTSSAHSTIGHDGTCSMADEDGKSSSSGGASAADEGVETTEEGGGSTRNLIILSENITGAY